MSSSGQPYDLTQTVLADFTQAQLQSLLAGVNKALTDFLLGQQAVTVTVTGGGQHREVSFNKSDQAQLLYFKRMIMAQLGMIAMPRRPIFVGF